MTQESVDDVLTDLIYGWPHGYHLTAAQLVRRIIEKANDDETALAKLRLRHGYDKPPEEEKP